MAGDWIKMRVNLTSDPAVIKVSRLLDCSEFKVVGLLHWLWGWADTHTEDGNAVGIDCVWINKQAGVEGFCEALVDVGWLEMHKDGITIPNFSSHNGASAKSRANGARRAANFKAKKEETPIYNAPAKPIRTKKVKKTVRKTDEIEKLLASEFPHLLNEDKAEATKTWMAELAETLKKPYTERGARQLLKLMDDMSPEELTASVAMSLQRNYQGLFPPNKQHGQGRTKGNSGSNQSRFEEYGE
mgnify:CR=1 FL=1